MVIEKYHVFSDKQGLNVIYGICNELPDETESANYAIGSELICDGATYYLAEDRSWKELG